MDVIGQFAETGNDAEDVERPADDRDRDDAADERTGAIQDAVDERTLGIAGAHFDLGELLLDLLQLTQFFLGHAAYYTAKTGSEAPGFYFFFLSCFGFFFSFCWRLSPFPIDKMATDNRAIVACPSMSASFSVRESFLRDASRESAPPRDIFASEYLRTTGRRAFVYFAPIFQTLCSCTRRERSLVVPV